MGLKPRAGTSFPQCDPAHSGIPTPIRYNERMNTIHAFLADRIRVTGLFSLTLVLGVVGIWLSAAPTSTTTGGRIPAAREGFLAPDFELETLDGGELRLTDFRGQVVLLNLWASWCPPCRAEMPAIQALYTKYQGQDLAVLAVHMTHQDSIPAAQAFVEELGLTFPVLLDRTGLVANLYRMRALPSTFIIDGEGVIREVVIGGPISELTLQSMITDILRLES